MIEWAIFFLTFFSIISILELCVFIFIKLRETRILTFRIEMTKNENWKYWSFGNFDLFRVKL
jgi:hypothetical protein